MAKQVVSISEMLRRAGGKAPEARSPDYEGVDSQFRDEGVRNEEISRRSFVAVLADSREFRGELNSALKRMLDSMCSEIYNLVDKRIAEIIKAMEAESMKADKKGNDFGGVGSGANIVMNTVYQTGNGNVFSSSNSIDRSEQLRKYILKLKEVSEESNSEDAIEVYNKIKEEAEKENPSPSVLARLVGRYETIVPAVDSTKNLIEAFLKLFS